MKIILILLLLSPFNSSMAEVTNTESTENETSSRLTLTDVEKTYPLFIHVDKSAGVQTMRIFKLGQEVASFPASTGREVGESNYSNPNFEPYCSSTPTGTYGPTVVKDLHLSRQWGGAAMYNSIFFKGGYAIHGVDEKYYDQLGQRASGGCIRLTQPNSKKVIDYVREVGQKNVKISVIDSSSLKEKYNIETTCDDQMKVVRCAQKELASQGYYSAKTNPPVQNISGGETFTRFNIDRGFAYQLEEECRAKLAASGAFWRPVRFSPRPRPRPANFPKNHPNSDSYTDGNF